MIGQQLFGVAADADLAGFHHIGAMRNLQGGLGILLDQKNGRILLLVEPLHRAKNFFDQEGRQRIIEMLWEMAMADGVVHEFESNLVWRAAELLGVSTRDRVRLRKMVASRAGIAPES